MFQARFWRSEACGNFVFLQESRVSRPFLAFKRHVDIVIVCKGLCFTLILAFGGHMEIVFFCKIFFFLASVFVAFFGVFLCVVLLCCFCS